LDDWKLKEDSDTPGGHNQPFYHKVSIPTFLAGIIAGILALGKDPWWTLQGAGSSQIITLHVSPFYLETYATGLEATTSAAMAIGVLTRVLVGIASLLLIISSIKPTAWWRNLAQWFNITALTQMFLSLAILINTARQEILAEYGTSLPLYGQVRFPANVLGLDLRFYPSPVITAVFGPLFYAGVFCLGLVAAERLASLRSIEELFRIGDIREMDLLPPYRRVWMSSDNKGLNPLSEDPERVTDEQLMVSFGNIFRTVEPGGIVRILLPSWAGWVGDRIRGLIKSVGFNLETTAVVREHGDDEIELRLKKPVESIKPVRHETVTVDGRAELSDKVSEREPLIGGLGVNVEEAIASEPPPNQIQSSIADSKPQIWSRSRPVNKREIAMVRSAARVIGNHGSPVEYRELLSQVYRDLLENSTGDFGSIREIEGALLRHVGQELLLIDQESQNGFRRDWWIGEEPVADVPASHWELERMKAIARSANSRMKEVGRRLRPEKKSGYKKRRTVEDE
jgi:hypothetical protein